MYSRRGFGLSAPRWAGHGWRQGFAAGRNRAATQQVTEEGYTYVGPCRCGFGPHAFYRDAGGKLVRPGVIWNKPASPVTDLVEQLMAEKKELEKRLAVLEEKLKE